MYDRHQRRSRIGLFLAVVLTSVGLSAPFAWAECAQAERSAGQCRQVEGSTSDNDVTIRVDSSTPGSPGSTTTTESEPSEGVPAGQEGAPPPRVPARPGPPPPPRLPVIGSSDCQVVVAGMCRGGSPPKTQPAADPAPPVSEHTPPTPPRSVSDLDTFVPDRPGLSIQPGEWSMPRLPTNFVANARSHRQSGELLGWPIEVRFTPHRFHWSFGDGHRATFSQAGATWQALGRRQFDPTPTSHVYQKPGVYQVRLRVEYRAEFRFVGESWQRLSGTVSSTSQTGTLRVLTVSPLLLGD